ncbi:MAG: zf-HC2 domain-containing protein, partial [Phycisphaerae bacterium]|nr:zf-HC2 domain-containing protein [Phycisphaerae bacterium]
MQPHPAQDELLSAYLDGELEEGERRLVEARLESDPAARALLAELRGASAALRSL